MPFLYGVASPIFLPFFFSLQFFSLSRGCDPSDRAALLAFSSALNFPLWLPANRSASDCCSWVGVRCAEAASSSSNSTRRVVRLQLYNMTLSGPVSGALGRLDQLKFLDLSLNNFSGSIPQPLFRARSLETIDLSDNLFSGPVSGALGGLDQLKFLNLSLNNLSGSIPQQLFRARSLETIDLSDNHFSGPIPDAFPRLKKLLTFKASKNAFSGPLPVSLSSCSALALLDVGYNHLLSQIDVNFTTLTKLEILQLQSNLFTGNIPNSISFCTSLRLLQLADNVFHGSIPLGFKFPDSLQYLYLSGNNFTDITRVLLALEASRNLTLLDLAGNFKREEMPGNGIVGFQNLKVLRIRNCELSGVIPTWLSKSQKLVMLDLSQNRLTGEIPLFLTQLKSLVNVTPFELMNFPVLPVGRSLPIVTIVFPAMDLSSNLLSGTTWMLLGNLRKLIYLNLSHNSFSGSIPDRFSNLTNLEALDLSSNQISGTIPSSLQRLTFLSQFSVANNNLSGDVPNTFQFSTFPPSSFDGNPGLCYAGHPVCHAPPSSNRTNGPTENFNPQRKSSVVMGFPCAVGVLIGFSVTVLICGSHCG